MIKVPLTKLLFIDIETVGIDKNYEECQQNHPILANLFDKYYSWFLKKFPEDNIPDLGPTSQKDYVYCKRTALIPEFSKIICACLAFITEDGKIHKQNLCGHDEVKILQELQRLLNYFGERDFYLCGHNIKHFDIPTISKRMVINGLMPPKIIPSYDVKPWDMKIVDTRDIWQFGANSTISSLDLMCGAMDIQSSKDNGIKGDDVHETYWMKNSLDDICEYCQKDVMVLIETIKKLIELK